MGHIPLPDLDRSIITAEWSQRAQGAVLGSAAGDALGAPFEFLEAGRYAATFPEPVPGGVGEMQGNHLWAPAEFTDDTQMAIVQARSLLAHGGLDDAALFDAFRTWAAHAKDVGISTGAVLGSGLVGAAAAEDHFRRTGRSAGNGSVMRAVPTAVLLAAATEEESIALARATAAVTHGDPAAGWGTAILHVIIRAALRGEDPWAAMDRLLGRLPEDQAAYRDILAPDWEPSWGVRLPDGTDLGTRNVTVWGCLAQAVWAVRTTESFHDAVVAAVDLGDDADTVAAVAGGIAGAIHGVAAIPTRWTTYLHGTIRTEDGPATYRLRDLRALVSTLLGAQPGAMERPADDLGPVEVAEGVHAANLNGAASVPEDWAVISLCLVDDLFEHHRHRREVYLVDRDPGVSGHPNMGLDHAVRDALGAIAAFRAEGRPVVVHCHGGASRTGLVLRAHLMAANGWTDAEAIGYLQELWPHLGLWNASFTDYLAGGAAGPGRWSPQPANEKA